MFDDVLSKGSELLMQTISKAKSDAEQKRILLELLLHETRMNRDLIQLLLTKTLGDDAISQAKIMSKMEWQSFALMENLGLSSRLFAGIGITPKDSFVFNDILEENLDGTPLYVLFEFVVRKTKQMQILAELDLLQKGQLLPKTRLKNILRALRQMDEVLRVELILP